MKDVIRLKPSSKVILEQYDFDANMAIIRMDTLLKQLQNVTKPAEKALQPVTFSSKQPTWAIDGIQGSLNFDASYWKKIAETVDSCIERAKRY